MPKRKAATERKSRWLTIRLPKTVEEPKEKAASSANKVARFWTKTSLQFIPLCPKASA